MGKKLLIVEDCETQRKSLKNLLERIGYDVTDIGSGTEMVELLLKEPFDAVLTDLQLPGLDGVKAAEIIKKSEGPNREVPIIAVTGISDDHYHLGNEFISTIFKPINIYDLSGFLDFILSNPGQEYYRYQNKI